MAHRDKRPRPPGRGAAVTLKKVNDPVVGIIFIPVDEMSETEKEDFYTAIFTTDPFKENS